MLLKIDNELNSVTFAEVPEEISLCLSVTCCPNRCPGCHSPFLRKNYGEILTFEYLQKLIKSNEGITCVCLLGGDINTKEVENIGNIVKMMGLKFAWYSGRDLIPEGIDYSNFDYIKIGSYKEEYGPLNKKTTNQKMFKISKDNNGDFELNDITKKFWRKL